MGRRCSGAGGLVTNGMWVAIKYNPLVRSSVLATCLLIGAIVLFRHVWTRPTRVRSTLIHLGVSVCSLIYALTIAELLLYFFFAESSATGGTLASRRWIEKYWSPINTLEYRDLEHSQANLSGKRILCVLGDSFAAGYGIADTGDRYSDLLGDGLGDLWAVVNVAKPGWSTPHEYDALVSYPHKPDVVLLSYYINDIDDAAARKGFTRPALSMAKPELLRSWINRSHLLNLACSRWHARTHPEAAHAYWRHLYQCYSNEKVWNEHKRELLDIVRFCESEQITLVTLVIPNLRDVEASRPITSRVARLFADRGIRVVDLTDSLTGRDPADLVVNPFDAHANEKLNREIAETLLDTIAGIDTLADGGL